jgi:ketopantoate reductase
MKTVILGAGAMGSVIGGTLARAGNEVVLIEVAKEIVDAIEQRGLLIEDRAGQKTTVKLQATHDPSQAGLADLIIVFVKCYHTETAVRQAAVFMGPNTTASNTWEWKNSGLESSFTCMPSNQPSPIVCLNLFAVAKRPSA